jgi:type IV secretion system protein VirD4
MTADEIMRLPGPKKDAKGDIIDAGEMLVFVAGQPVIRGRQILYFQDPTFAARSKMPPPKKSDRVRVQPEPPKAATSTSGGNEKGGFVIQ